MALRPSDFRLTLAQLQQARAALEAWDARNPWAPDPRPDELAITKALNAACAPRLLLMPSAVQAAKFVREIVAGPNTSPP